MAWHSAASIIRPVSVSSIVRDRPMRGSISIGPVTLGMPALISGWPMRTPVCPTRTSVSMAAWKAEPAATPLSAARQGLSRSRMAL